jgi:hypothetical protein
MVKIIINKKGTSMLKILTLFFLVIYSVFSFGKVTSDEQIWANLNTFINLKPTWQLYFELQPRLVDYQRQHGTSLYRGAIGKLHEGGFSSWFGYAFIERTFPSYLHEDRLFFQFMHAKDVKKNFKLINRSRFESRHFRSYHQPSFRLRHLVRGQYRFNNSNWGLVSYNEWFWNSNNVNDDKGISEGFDQNRFFAGVSYYFGEMDQHLGEIGYMNQYINRHFNDNQNHVLALQITFRY